MMSYENQRVVFDTLTKKYKDYIWLYKLMNNGSLEGASTFAHFYLRMTYYSKYSDPREVTYQGY